MRPREDDITTAVDCTFWALALSLEARDVRPRGARHDCKQLGSLVANGCPQQLGSDEVQLVSGLHCFWRAACAF